MTSQRNEAAMFPRTVEYCRDALPKAGRGMTIVVTVVIVVWCVDGVAAFLSSFPAQERVSASEPSIPVPSLPELLTALPEGCAWFVEGSSWRFALRGKRVAAGGELEWHIDACPSSPAPHVHNRAARDLLPLGNSSELVCSCRDSQGATRVELLRTRETRAAHMQRWRECGWTIIAATGIEGPFEELICRRDRELFRIGCWKAPGQDDLFLIIARVDER
jgi:hypothetical protein